MKHFLHVTVLYFGLVFLGSALASNTLDNTTLPQGYKKFIGGWFSILYPSDFKVRISQRSESDGEHRAESVFFISPGNEVEFYVFSPQWDSEARDIDLIQATENMGDKTVSKKGEETTTMWTIIAKDGSYSRSYREVRTENTRLISGLRYKNKAAHGRYKKEYIKFRDSIEQYAD